jgi:HAD superfamily hydrolase (TIGR01509 family)
LGQDNHPIDALVFDFDGLILETETPIYLTWGEIFQSYGCQLPFEKWTTIIGSANVAFDPLEELQRQLHHTLDQDEVLARQRQQEHALILRQPVLPGVRETLDSAVGLGLKIGLASSSPCDWVEGHLERLGLRAYFEQIRASDDVEFTKPDPALYVEACAALGVPPARALALEDSPNGALAAKRAGMYCVAVPNPLTRELPFPDVDLRLDSLADLPLEALLAKLRPGRPV